MIYTMSQTAKLFTNGRSQAVRLPAAYRFEGAEVFIWRDEHTGDVILSAKPPGWESFLAALEGTDIPDDFLGPSERSTTAHERDPFAGWTE